METPEFLSTLTAMRGFLDASRSKSQEEILKAFLQHVIHRRHLCESGSVLIDYPEERMLHLFNPDNFLTKQGYLKPGEPWQVEFAYDQGLAGEAFNKREAIYVEIPERIPVSQLSKDRCQSQACFAFRSLPVIARRRSELSHFITAVQRSHLRRMQDHFARRLSRSLRSGFQVPQNGLIGAGLGTVVSS